MAKINKINPDGAFGSKTRSRLYYAMVALFFLSYLGRLAYLQIFRGADYRIASETQAIKQIIIEPFRGSMTDRFGNKIVHNEASFSVTITRNDFRDDALPLLSSIMQIPEEEIEEKIANYENLSKFTPIKIFTDVEFDKIALIEEYSDLLPGIDISVESKRLYDFEGRLGHLLGYAKEVTKSEIEEREYYRPGDLIGKSGLESAYEMEIRGRKGAQFVAVNKLGKKVASFDNGKSDVAARNGDDLILTIDPELQYVAEQALEGRRGAAVVLDPQNGEILAIVSKPDFDPRDFSGKISRKLYNSIMNDPGKPMMFRALRAMQPRDPRGRCLSLWAPCRKA
jgi:penicillin-binding protein 2